MVGVSSTGEPDVLGDVLEDIQDADGVSYSDSHYTDSLACCPSCGTILGEGTRRDRADRECPSCRRVWKAWEVFNR